MQPATEPHRFISITRELEPHAPLHARVVRVPTQLPEKVLQDFLSDHRFRITIDNYTPEQGWTLFMPTPGPIGFGTSCVVLRLKLSHCDEAFAFYVIAHEFAHAFLRNGPWGDITDVEEAADACCDMGILSPALANFATASYRRVNTAPLARRSA